MLPPDALNLPVAAVLDTLRSRFGNDLDRALSGEPVIPGPHRAPGTGTGWIRRANVVGINVRTVGSFWKTIHYVLTLSPVQDSIHFLPVWEPGVVGSLYGVASRHINPEFYDAEIASEIPALYSAELQLCAVVNVLHLLGRSVGMDVIPHTDRFSEIVLGNPALFEWMRRDGERIVDHRASLHEEVEKLIEAFVASEGPAIPRLQDTRLFGAHSEAERNLLLFGLPDDQEGRNRRRSQLVHFLHSRGYEPVPATMGPPYRGIEVDPDKPPGGTAHEKWYEYRITRPQPMSRVFGPLARYKFYERKNDNRDWEIDFTRPREFVWDYFEEFYASVQRRFDFDYMRGDMSHVQMRPDGVPPVTDRFYDPLRAVKERVQRQVPSFAYFAESFLAPSDTMAYGDEVDHLEASRAEVTLGDLQSEPVGSLEFLQRFRYYLDVASTRTVIPSQTVLTGDKDDPRFDGFYLGGNELRLFCALCIVDMPSYMALGFRLRDEHPSPVPNEYYSKLFVFHEDDGPKATTGPYRFGSNVLLYKNLERLFQFVEKLPHGFRNGSVSWLLPPSPTAATRVIAWEVRIPEAIYLFVCNTDTHQPVKNRRIPGTRSNSPASVSLLFSTDPASAAPKKGVPCLSVQIDGPQKHFFLDSLRPGECRAYRIQET